MENLYTQELLSFILEQDELIADYSLEQVIHEVNLDDYMEELD